MNLEANVLDVMMARVIQWGGGALGQASASGLGDGGLLTKIAQLEQQEACASARLIRCARNAPCGPALGPSALLLEQWNGCALKVGWRCVPGDNACSGSQRCCPCAQGAASKVLRGLQCASCVSRRLERGDAVDLLISEAQNSGEQLR
jgi:hypothetical protein